MDSVLQHTGVFLYRPPEFDCPWLLVVLKQAKVEEAVPFGSEPEARRALIARTRLYIEQQVAREDMD